jgi:hypothetical protein
LLYWSGAKFNFNDATADGEKVFMAIFTMMFGAFASG